MEATLTRVENAYESFAALLRLYEEGKPKKSGISKLSSISESATLGKDLYVGDFTCISDHVTLGDGVLLYPQVYIGENVKIGDRTILHPGVKVYEGCEIGADCVIHGGVIIGADGFGFAPNHENNYEKIPQVGKVIIEDHVEVGANSTIDRATMGATILRKGVKLDNLIQIAHNVEVGENTVMAAQAGIAGSTKLGKNCMVGGQTAIVGHLTIADGAKMAGKSGILKNIKIEDARMSGIPAIDSGSFNRSTVIFRKLPELSRQIDALEKKVAELTQTAKS